MQKQESKVNKSVAGDKELSRKEEIDGFLNSHLTDSRLHDVSVREMRHCIPLFLMEVYSEKYGQYTKKVKGLWEKCPDDWRADVPFVDPNNKLKSDDGKNCKPKKDLLEQMLKYLIERYMDKQKTGSPFGRLLSNSEMCFDLVETEETSVRPSASSLDQHSLYSSSLTLNSGSCCSANQMSSRSVFDSGHTGDLLNSFLLSLEQENLNLEGVVFDTEDSIFPPKQAVDNEDASAGEDWDPVLELKQRISQKLQFIKKQKLANGADIQMLGARYNDLKEAVIDDVNCGSVIDALHSLEKDIDKLRFSKRSSNEERFSETPLDQFSKKPDESKDETLYKRSDIDVCTDLPVEVPVEVQDPLLMSSLNIKARLMGAQPTGPIGQLQLRSGLSSDMQSTAPLKTAFEDMQSTVPLKNALEYCTPVQPAEDDNLTGPSQNTILPYDFLLASFENLVPVEEQMSELQLADVIGENRIVTPVQETGAASYAAAPAADKMDIVPDFGRASDLSLHTMFLDNEFASGVDLPTLHLENFDTFSPDLIRLLQQFNSIMAVPQPSTELAQPTAVLAQPAMDTAQSPMVTAQSPMVTAQSPMFVAQPPMVTAKPPMVAGQARPFSVGSQPRTTYTRSQGKREYPFDDEDEDVEMVAASSQSDTNPEASYGGLIPTTVEELSNLVNLPSSKSNKKTRRSTWKDQA